MNYDFTIFTKELDAICEKCHEINDDLVRINRKESVIFYFTKSNFEYTRVSYDIFYFMFNGLDDLFGPDIPDI